MMSLYQDTWKAHLFLSHGAFLALRVQSGNLFAFTLIIRYFIFLWNLCFLGICSHLPTISLKLYSDFVYAQKLHKTNGFYICEPIVSYFH